MERKRSAEDVREIKKMRMAKGFFTCGEMADEMNRRGVKISRQSYCNKEAGRTGFNIDEIQCFADICEMSLVDAVNFLRL